MSLRDWPRPSDLAASAFKVCLLAVVDVFVKALFNRKYFSQVLISKDFGANISFRELSSHSNVCCGRLFSELERSAYTHAHTHTLKICLFLLYLLSWTPLKIWLGLKGDVFLRSITVLNMMNKFYMWPCPPILSGILCPSSSRDHRIQLGSGNSLSSKLLVLQHEDLCSDPQEWCKKIHKSCDRGGERS